MTIPKNTIENKSQKNADQPAPVSLHRPSYIEIDTAALRHNIRYIKSMFGPATKFMAVVKANAYGHGAVEISKIALEEGADFLGVAFLEEAIELRNNFNNASIVLLYPENLERSIEAVRRGINITIGSPADFKSLSEICGRTGLKFNYFIKAETGMNRYGMTMTDILAYLPEMIKNDSGNLIGISTNLADSYGDNSRMSAQQLNNFRGIADSLKNLIGREIYFSHESSSSLWKNKMTAGGLARIGHLLYGLAPADNTKNGIRPVMSLKSRIAQIHDIKKGQGVGYGFTFTAKLDSRIAVVPVGYADGYPWSLSNKGQVLIHGRNAPVAGKICMDAFMVDVTEIPESRENDDVVLLGSMGSKTINAHELAGWANSFSYEILSRFSPRLPRIYK